MGQLTWISCYRSDVPGHAAASWTFSSRSRSRRAALALQLDGMAAMKRAGLVPHTFTADEHIHAHLDVFVNGEAVPVPPGIGVVAPVDTGGQNIQSAWNKMAPVHTHEPDGILHIHTGIPEIITLGQFFDSDGCDSPINVWAPTAPDRRERCMCT
jgi:hypothetical protein